MLQLSDLTYRIGQRLLLDNASASIPTGHKVGLIGRNGMGKSTLLRIIAGEIGLDGGRVEVSPRTRMGWVQQEMPEKATPIGFVLAADTERASLLEEAETATDPERIAEIHIRLADISAHSAPSRAAEILSGLGFDTEAQERPLESFSGGWRMRVALAATLFAAPDLLLLDEPSNHLDFETRIWLESHLVSYQGTILLVSHDRGLLNKIVDGILHLDDGKLTFYRGDYENFEKTRAERRMLQAAAIAKQTDQRQKMQAFVDRFRAKASKAKQAQSRIKALARMEELAPLQADPEVVFNFPDPVQLAPPLIALESVSAGYGPEAVILKGLGLRIDMDDRIGLLGSNGNGKSTFLRTLAGELKPLAGELRKSGKLRVGYFCQEQADAFDLSLSAYQHMTRVMGGATETKVRGQLGRFGFSQQRAETKIGVLSGGEKARLLFATITIDAPHILLLDEPTNHLDIEAREALINALNGYQGAVILVSHDPHMLELCVERLWVVAGGTCKSFDGDIESYGQQLMADKRSESASASKSAAPQASRKEGRKAGADQRAALAPLRKSVQSAEKRLDNLTRYKEAAERDLADPALYADQAGASRVVALKKKLAELERDMVKAESDWIAAQDALERAEMAVAAE
ncbi:MAG TPA: ABC-F family ATP-binding cassette domain-containing protein [Alphaproteobacteria bacterium]|jgi:ATP-binding cassette subfamily F protein 3